jgi:hypothetical protein
MFNIWYSRNTELFFISMQAIISVSLTNLLLTSKTHHIAGNRMLTGIEYRPPIGPNLRRENLEPYWAEYFDYESRRADLHEIMSIELQAEVDRARQLARPYLNSQQAIARVLAELGNRAIFHRQFNESFPDYRPHQILGMQLYAIMAADDTLWVYTQTQHARTHVSAFGLFHSPG